MGEGGARIGLGCGDFLEIEAHERCVTQCCSFFFFFCFLIL